MSKHRSLNNFLLCLEDKFVFQKVRKGMREGAILVLILTNKEELVDDKVVRSLEESDPKLLEYSI